MNKIILAGLIAFTMVAVAGSAVAWKIDIEANVCDADVDISAGVAYVTPTESYIYTTTAGVDGSGKIDILGSANEIKGKWDSLKTKVETKGEGPSSIYATQTMLVAGCLVDCAEGPCNDCPQYLYGAASGATIDGNGEIKLKSDVVNNKGDNEQKLEVHGEGTFTAGMLVAYQIEGQEPVTHAMGAYGVNVGFCAMGETDFNTYNGATDGYFGAMMHYQDESCPNDNGADDDCCQ